MSQASEAGSEEKRAGQTAEEPGAARPEATRLNEELAGLRMECELTRRLAAEGAKDIEAAVLMAKSRLAGGGKEEIDGVIGQLKKEKQYLFEESADGAAGQKAGPSALPRTSGARDKAAGRGAAIEASAKKAATTGSRADVQEYMRRRRRLS